MSSFEWKGVPTTPLRALMQTNRDDWGKLHQALRRADAESRRRYCVNTRSLEALEEDPSTPLYEEGDPTYERSYMTKGGSDPKKLFWAPAPAKAGDFESGALAPGDRSLADPEALRKYQDSVRLRRRTGAPLTTEEKNGPVFFPAADLAQKRAGVDQYAHFDRTKDLIRVTWSRTLAYPDYFDTRKQDRAYARRVLPSRDRESFETRMPHRSR